MKMRKTIALFCAALCFAVTATACSSERTDDVSTAESSDAEETVTTAAAEEAETTAAPETTTAAPETTAAAETDADGDDTDETDETAATTAPEEEESKPTVSTNSNRTDNDTKILWSERGLEAVKINSVDGYGEELAVGESYVGWTLDSFDGILDDDANQVAEMYADFTYDGTLATNGQITVLPADHPVYPKGLYLRVDNQADFPYFPKDTRTRGLFIIENARDVYSMLGMEESDAAPDSVISVSVSVSSLHVHLAPDGYDTIRVTAASLR